MQKLAQGVRGATDTGEASVLDAIVEGDAKRVETLLPRARSKRQAAQGARLRARRTQSDRGQRPDCKKVPKVDHHDDDLAVHPRRGAGRDGRGRTAGTRRVDQLFRDPPTHETALFNPFHGARTATPAPSKVDVPEARGRREEVRLRRVRVLTWYFMLAERLPLQRGARRGRRLGRRLLRRVRAGRPARAPRCPSRAHGPGHDPDVLPR